MLAKEVIYLNFLLAYALSEVIKVPSSRFDKLSSNFVFFSLMLGAVVVFR